MVRSRSKSLVLCALAALGISATHAAADNKYSNADGPLNFSASSVASVYPSTITVSGEDAPIGKVTLRLDGLTHTNPDDLDILLVSPTGARMLVMSDCGGTANVNGITFVLDDAAASQLPDSNALANNATYRPRNVGGGDTFPAPAPNGPYTANFTGVRGTDANGDWTLYIVNDAGGSGSLSGWSLTVTPALCVTTTANGGAGSLRAAITAANSTAGRDYICFNIPGAGPHTIALTSQLPTISDETVIDGLSQPGADANVWPPILQIVLDGQNNIDDGLRFDGSADASAVRGLVIQRFTDNGLQIEGADGVVVQMNHIGTDVAGTAAMANGGSGIRLGFGTSNCLIGGIMLENLTDLESGAAVLPMGRNIISGNREHGILVESAGNTRIIANHIGVSVQGNQALGNGTDGIRVSGLSLNTRIGTDSDGVFDLGEGNIISANGRRGIMLTDLSARTVIAGNHIGVGADGVTALGNGHEGVLIDNVDENTVGTNGDSNADDAEGNIISRNLRDGVRLNSDADYNAIAGNRIGVDIAGDAAGNLGHGVAITRNAENNRIGSNNDGRNDDGEANTIAHNGGDGVNIEQAGVSAEGVGDNNDISRNSIHSNGGLGIDLGTDGVTPNDPNDPDNGPNELKNFPVIATVDAMGNVSGTYNSVVNRVYRIEFFNNTVADPSNHGEGEEFAGAVEITTNNSGNATINAAITLNPAKPFVSATATDLRFSLAHGGSGFIAGRGTSEFSGIVQGEGTGQTAEPLPQSVTTCEDSCIVITLAANDADGLDFIIFSLPTAGTLHQYSNGPGAVIDTLNTIVTDSQHRVVFCPAENGNGTPYTTFQFAVADGQIASGPATVTVNVTPVNDRPTFGVMKNPQNPVIFSEYGGEQCKPGFIINFGGGGDDAEDLSQTISNVIITEVSDPNGILAAPISVSNDGTLCVTTNPNTCGVVTYRIAVVDSGGTDTCNDANPAAAGINTSYSISTSFTVNCSNDPPVALCRDITIDLTSSCTLYNGETLAALINNGSYDAEDGTDVELAVVFTDSGEPVPADYEFPLGSTQLTLRVTDQGIDGDKETPAIPSQTSQCTAKVTVIGDDCNGNGYADSCDIAFDRSVDCDGNLMPDECQCLWDNGHPDLGMGKGSVIPNSAQISHIGGGVPNSAKVADDFEFPNGFVHKVSNFRGEMLTNTLPFLRKAKLEFYEDCNGVPADEPFAKFTDGVIVNTVPAVDNYDVVTWEFDLCDEHLWLDGGKTYWVSLIAVTDNVTPDLSFWLTTTTGTDGKATLGSVPHKAEGTPPAPTPGGNPKPTSYQPWHAADGCCLGCVNMAFRMTGESCKVLWDNGPVAQGANAGGIASGANGAATARAVDNFVVPPCEPVEICTIEAFVWTNCEPPTAFIEIYRDAPCSLNYDFDPPVSQRIGPETTPIFRCERSDIWSVMRTDKSITIGGVVYHGYRLFFADIGLTLQPGTYWLSAGVNGTGSFAQSAFFAFNDPLCPNPGCGIKVGPGYSRRVTPLPGTAWLEGQRDFAFTLSIRTERRMMMDMTGSPQGAPTNTPACNADVDNNGEVDADDIFRYLDAWFAGCP